MACGGVREVGGVVLCRFHLVAGGGCLGSMCAVWCGGSLLQKVSLLSTVRRHNPVYKGGRHTETGLMANKESSTVANIEKHTNQRGCIL